MSKVKGSKDPVLWAGVNFFSIPERAGLLYLSNYTTLPESHQTSSGMWHMVV